MKTTPLLSNVKLFILAFFLMAGTATFYGCAKEGCTNPESDNYDEDAKDDDGSCIPWRDKFIGSYSATQSCTDTTPESLNLTLTESSLDEKTIIMSDGTINWNAEVTGQNSLTIPLTSINVDGIAVNISGSGTITGTALRLTYTLAAGPYATDCTLDGNKQ